MFKILKIIFISVYCIFFSYVSSFSNGIQDLKIDDDPSAPLHIIADKIECHKDKDECYVTGNVIISKEGKKLFADFVSYRADKMIFFAKGNVFFITEEDEIKSDALLINFKNSTGTIYNGTIFNTSTDFYIKGELIEKTGENSYKASNATVSSCEGDVPDWKVTVRDLKIDMDNFGIAKDAKIWVKKAPVLYTPIFIFPANTERQTGFLNPKLGYSDVKGEEYIQPFFWAIDDSSDMTFYLDHMGKEGERLGVEYRYALTKDSKGVLMYDSLDAMYWFRGKINHKFSDFDAKADIDLVSDADYLQEFRSGIFGFDENNKYFQKYFYRSLEDYTENTRTNKINISKRWDKYTLNIDTIWYDDIKNTDDSIYKLPSVKLASVKQKIGKTNLYYDFDLGSEYLYREEADKIFSADIYPRFYLPIKFKYFNLETSLGLRQTFWEVNGYGDNKDEFLSRNLYDIKTDTSANIYNIFDSDFKNIDKIKHTIIPKISYEYMPDPDYNEYPEPVAEKNIITYSVTNYLTSRSVTKNKDKTSYSYNRFVKIEFWQSFDFIKQNDNIDRPFSDIYAEIEIYPKKYFSIKGDIGWSPYENNLNALNIGFTLFDSRKDNIFVEYRYNEEEKIESFYTNTLFQLNDSIALYLIHERNLYTNLDITTTAGLSYTKRCWFTTLEYTREANENKIGFMVSLNGLGHFGLN